MTRRILASAAIAGAALVTTLPATPASACLTYLECVVERFVPCIATPDTIICFD